MRKYVVFTEGRGELIFVRHILTLILGLDSLSFECFDLVSDRIIEIAFKHPNPSALIHYLIINVGTDERVASVIIERYEQYVSRGYEIIGLRDMFSEAYKRKSLTINPNVNDYLRERALSPFQDLPEPEKIHFFFAIMELEAWVLGLDVFERIDTSLTAERINQEIECDLRMIDPETTFFHPAVIVGRILGLANIPYGKHTDEMNRIIARVTEHDINSLVESGRCASFVLLVQEINNEIVESLSDAD